MTLKPDASEKSRTEKWLYWLKDNPVLAPVIVLGIVAAALFGFWDTVPQGIRTEITSSLGLSAPSPPPVGPTDEDRLVSDMFGHPGCVPMRLDRYSLDIPPVVRPGVVQFVQRRIGKSGKVVLVGIGIEGTDSAALQIGQRRAEAVMRFLVSQGVDRGELDVQWVNRRSPEGKVIPVGDGFFCGVWIKSSND